VDFLMDYLKTSAPFWKRETGPGGTRWVEPTAQDYAAQQAWKDQQ
jgi:molybdopterin synthase catalytic subunit